MSYSVKKHSQVPDTNPASQLLLAYIQQVGLRYEADKSIQMAVKKLEKAIRESR